MNYIARRDATAVNQTTGERGSIRFELLPTYAVDDGASYFCPIRITGQVEEVVNVGGVDSMQAVFLATEALRSLFYDLKSKKYDFFWPDSDHPMDSLDYRVKDSTLTPDSF